MKKREIVGQFSPLRRLKCDRVPDQFCVSIDPTDQRVRAKKFEVVSLLLQPFNSQYNPSRKRFQTRPSKLPETEDPEPGA